MLFLRYLLTEFVLLVPRILIVPISPCQNDPYLKHVQWKSVNFIVPSEINDISGN